jgi:hypothetical protein
VTTSESGMQDLVYKSDASGKRAQGLVKNRTQGPLKIEIYTYLGQKLKADLKRIFTYPLSTTFNTLSYTFTYNGQVWHKIKGIIGGLQTQSGLARFQEMIEKHRGER